MRTDLEFLHENTLKWLIHLLFSKDEEPLSINVEDWRLVKGFFNFIIEYKLDDCFTYTMRRCGTTDDEVQSLSRPQAYHFYKNFNEQQQDSVSLKELTLMDDPISFEGKKTGLTSIFKVLLFYLYIKENKKEEIQGFIKKYIDTYEKKELWYGDNYYSPKVLKEVVSAFIIRQNEFFGGRFVFKEDDFYSFLPEEYNSKYVKFYELILYLYLNKIIEIDDCKFVNFNVETSNILIEIIVSSKNIETIEHNESDSKEVCQNKDYIEIGLSENKYRSQGKKGNHIITIGDDELQLVDRQYMFLHTLVSSNKPVKTEILINKINVYISKENINQGDIATIRSQINNKFKNKYKSYKHLLIDASGDNKDGYRVNPYYCIKILKL